MSLRNIHPFVFIALAIIIILTLAYWFGLFGGGSDAQQEAAPPAVPVSAMRLERKDVAVERELPGRTVAYQISDIRPQVTGIVTERLFEEGAEVKEGQQLYQIDPAQYEATVNSARADIAKAQANVETLEARAERYAEVVKINAISQQEYDDIVAQLAQAKADVGIAQATMEMARINLAYTKVYAPITGRIGRSSVTKGALVTANQMEPLAQITQLDPIYIDMTQSSEEFAQMREMLQEQENIPVSITLDQQAKPYAHEGKLQFSEVTVDPTTGSILLRAIAPNPDGALYPGVFVRAQLKLKANSAIMVPQKATIRNADGTASVWMIDKDNKANPVPVKVGQTFGDQWLIEDGVKEGDVIVIEGFQKLRPGTPVQIAKEDDKLPTPQASEGSGGADAAKDGGPAATPAAEPQADDAPEPDESGAQESR